MSARPLGIPSLKLNKINEFPKKSKKNEEATWTTEIDERVSNLRKTIEEAEFIKNDLSDTDKFFTIKRDQMDEKEMEEQEMTSLFMSTVNNEDRLRVVLNDAPITVGDLETTRDDAVVDKVQTSNRSKYLQLKELTEERELLLQELNNIKQQEAKILVALQENQKKTTAVWDSIQNE